ncbi:MAG: trypsin-like peptidase domain-containing protein, partial [Candidatus Nitrosopolaris sp.]
SGKQLDFKTCSHIVRKLLRLEVSLSNGKSFPAKVIGNDPYSDIPLLKIQANGKNDSISLNPIEIGDSENLKAGQFVLALSPLRNPYPMICNILWLPDVY